jgi:hypothetical protein
MQSCPKCNGSVVLLLTSAQCPTCEKVSGTKSQPVHATTIYTYEELIARQPFGDIPDDFPVGHYANEEEEEECECDKEYDEDEL